MLASPKGSAIRYPWGMDGADWTAPYERGGTKPADVDVPGSHALSGRTPRSDGDEV